MPHMAAFHQCLYCLLRQFQSSEKEKHFLFFEIITFDPSIYTMDHPDLTVSNLMENPIGLKRVNQKIFLNMEIMLKYGILEIKGC